MKHYHLYMVGEAIKLNTSRVTSAGCRDSVDDSGASASLVQILNLTTDKRSPSPPPSARDFAQS